MLRSLMALIVVSAVACTTTTGDDTTPVSASPPETSPPTTVEAPTTTDETAVESTTSLTQPSPTPAEELELVSFPVPGGSGPHDVAPGNDGLVWYTAQNSGDLGRLDPSSGETRHIDLGPDSRPHGVIVDEAGTPWITDGGLNAIVSVDPGTEEVTVYPLPDERADSNLNTATFDGDGILWFTGQAGIYGRLDPATGEMELFNASGGRGPYGITTTPDGDVYYASLAGSHIGAIGGDGAATVIEPPTPDQGARRVWSDSMGQIWVSEWNTGNLSRYTPTSGVWDTWHLPGESPQTYAVYVDEHDLVWASDFGSNSMVRFDPTTEEFDIFPLPHDQGEVRQILGRSGEVWAPESSADNLFVIREPGS